MRHRNYIICMEDMLDAINKIELYIKHIDYDEFVHSDMIIDAVLRNIEVFGEAAKNIPERIRKKYPRIPWKRIVGLRNIVIHEYFGVDLENIWKIITENIPETKPIILKVLAEMKKIDSMLTANMASGSVEFSERKSFLDLVGIEQAISDALAIKVDLLIEKIT